MAKHRARRAAGSRGKPRIRGGAAWVRQDPRFGSTLRRLDTHGFAWDDVASEILPVFERARPFSYPVDPPALAVLPPGVTVGFGIDAGPAFLRISVAQLARWPVDLPGLAQQALGNLARRAREADERDLLRDAVDDVPVTVFQSHDGWASTTVLLPDEVARLFGPGPALFVAPSRDLLIGLPIDVDPEFATWLTEEFEAIDPNALRLEAFEWRDGTVRCRPLARTAVAI
jgi:hypothetical protein